MKIHNLWFATLFAFSLSLGAIAQAAENPDVQSAEEIAKAQQIIAHDFANAVSLNQISESDRNAILKKYDYLDPYGEVPADLLKTAVIYFDANRSSFPNKNYITVVDFKPRSDHYRFFLINMNDGSVEKFHTTHGLGSDRQNRGYAKSFGNVINSEKSSLGFVRTAEIFYGTYHRAVRLDGISKSNSNLRARAVIVHGWDGVHEANVIEGLSWGCMALDWKVKDGVIDKIKEGSLIYAGVSHKAN